VSQTEEEAAGAGASRLYDDDLTQEAASPADDSVGAPPPPPPGVDATNTHLVVADVIAVDLPLAAVVDDVAHSASHDTAAAGDLEAGEAEAEGDPE